MLNWKNKIVTREVSQTQETLSVDREVITLGVEVLNPETRSNFIYHSNKFDKIITELNSKEAFLKFHENHSKVYLSHINDEKSLKSTSIDSMKIFDEAALKLPSTDLANINAAIAKQKESLSVLVSKFDIGRGCYLDMKPLYANKSVMLKEACKDYVQLQENIRNASLYEQDILPRLTQLFSKFTPLDFVQLKHIASINELLTIVVLEPFMYACLGTIFAFKVMISVFSGKNIHLLLVDIAERVRSGAFTLYRTHFSVYAKTTVRYIGVAGAAGSMFMMSYKYLFAKSSAKTVAKITGTLYTGFSGTPGAILDLYRNSASKLIFEVTKTASTFMNAAVFGWLEPKANIIKPFVAVIKEFVGKKIYT